MKEKSKSTSSSPTEVRVSPPPSCRIVQELFQDYNSLGYKQSKRDLDCALEERCQLIIIEPTQLGDETARAITIGNACHKATVISGITSIALMAFMPTRSYLWIPFGTVCASSFAMYTLGWQPDPCCKYQVERDQSILASLDYRNVNSHSVVVLRYRDDQYRRVLHTTVAVVAISLMSLRIYRLFKY